MIKNRLYNRSVEIVFHPNTHQYFVNGQSIPSVTTILNIVAKPALLYWGINMTVDYLQQALRAGIAYEEAELQSILISAKKAHTIKKDKAADIGTQVHRWIEAYIAGKNPAMLLDDQCCNAVEQFLKWEKEFNVKFLLSEQIVYSKSHNFVGTFDFIAKVDGKLMLCDIKTSKGIWDEYFLQLAAYRLARTEEYPAEQYQGNGIIRIGKDGEFEWKAVEDWEHHAQAFVAAKTLYEVLERMKKEKENNLSY